MRVDNNTRIGGPGTAKRSAKSGGSGSVFQPQTESGGGQARAVNSSGSLAPAQSLLALQGADGADDFKSGKRKAVARAENILDILDEIKMGLLIGEVPGPRLSALLRALERQRGQVADPDLAEVIDHIELRACVELAKFGR